MRLCLILLTAVVLNIACQPKNELSQVKFADGSAIYDPKELNELLNKTKISASQRMQSLQALQQAFKASYIGYDLKKSLTGVSGEETFSQCLQINSQNPDDMNTVQFYDEVLKCLSPLRDTHVNVTRKIAPTWVYTGIGDTTLIDGKAYILTVRPLLLKKFEELQNLPEGTLSNVLKAGRQIISVDGRSIADVMNELKKYSSDSSEAAADLNAVLSIFKRNFFYPQSNKLSVRVKSEDGTENEVSLFWVQFDATESIDSRLYLREQNITDLSGDANNADIRKRSGYKLNAPLFETLSESRHFFDQNKDLILVTGYGMIDQQKVCYIQNMSFDIDRGSQPEYSIQEQVEKDFKPIGYIDAIRQILTTCESQKLPVILDLRENGGGDASLTNEMFALFETTTIPVSYAGGSLSAAPANRPIYLAYLNSLSKTVSQTVVDLYYQAYQEAVVYHQDVASWILTRPLKSTTAFTGKLVVLTSPKCISACDDVSHRFKITARATLAGEPTNGTGFGFNSANQIDTKFEDSFRYFEVSIPNRAFRPVIVAEEPANQVQDTKMKGFLQSWTDISVMENQPTKPDVEIKLTPQDLIDFSDYIRALKPLL